MRVGEGCQRIVIDRCDRAALGEIEADRLAGSGRTIRLLRVDGLGHLGVVEGDRGVVAAVGGIAGHGDVAELEIVDFLQAALADGLQAHQFHRLDMRASGGVLEQRDETGRQPCDIDHQWIELHFAGAGAGAAACCAYSGQCVEGELIDREIPFIALDGGVPGDAVDLQEIFQRGSIMRMREAGQRIVIDRRDRAAALGEVETDSPARIERAVGVLSPYGFGHLAIVEGDRRIVAAIGGKACHRDVTEREIIDLLEAAVADGPHSDQFHGLDMRACGESLEERNETRRQRCDIDHQRIELRPAGAATTTSARQSCQFGEGKFVDREVAFDALALCVPLNPVDLQKISDATHR